MKRMLITILALAVVGKTHSQYRGGSDDGFQSNLFTQQNPMPSIYKGGTDDGFRSLTAYNQNAIPDIYHGGMNDGFTAVMLIGQNALPDIYTGGLNDGFHSVSLPNLNPLPNIYSGGADDGFNMKLYVAQNALPDIYRGGNNDGWSAGYFSDIYVSVIYIFDGTGNWNIASNWLNNVIPPSPLPAGNEIVINPSAGSCILNVPQIISPGAKIVVSAGKNFVVPGSIQ